MKPLDQVTNTKVDEPVNKKLDIIIGTFISLKFDVDTDEFSDGTLERWNNMKQSILALIASEKAKELETFIGHSNEIPESVIRDRIKELQDVSK